MKIPNYFASRKGMIIAGAAIGLLAAVLQFAGNPPNMGICMVCFLRDFAGAIGLHRAAVVQYLRPEVMGAVLGAMLAAWVCREWRPRSGSSPIARFLLGIFAAIGSLVFLGCSWRALIRLAGGDLNAVVGLAGLVVGIGVGCLFFRSGFSLGRNHPAPKIVGFLFPAVMVLSLAFLFFKTSFKEGEAIFFSEKGPGAMYAPVWLSLVCGLVIGALAQRSRFCTIGAARDAMLVRDFHLLSGVAAFVVVVFVFNLCTGALPFDWKAFGWEAMPISHANHLWNFLGMVLAGLCFTLAGGCPGRQLFLSGEGDGDAAVFCCGMIVGAATAHNWFLAAAPDKMVEGTLVLGGPALSGRVAVIAGILFCVVLGLTARSRATECA